MARPSFPHPWRIIPRPVLETILTNFAHHLRVPQPLLLHGPRGSGKTSLLLHRLLPDWNSGPHISAYLDFSPSPSPQSPSPSLLDLELESLTHRGILLGAIGSSSFFSALSKWRGFSAALRRLIGPSRLTKRDEAAPAAALWSKALIAFGGEEEALTVAKEVLRLQREWRIKALRCSNSSGRFSRTLANSATDWPCLLLEILSDAAEVDFFQPKLVINNIDVLRRTVVTDDSTVPAAMYHDSLIWRVVEMGVNDRCLPVTEVNPAMESALVILQKFASDVRSGKIPKEQLHFGAPWRHPPSTDDPVASLKWAKIQLMDFVQSLVNTEFGVNYLADKSFEILDDPSLIAMLEVGLLYQQRDPSFIRPITVGIQRCIVRWLVQERMQMSLQDYMSFLWQRIIRGRSYRHLMREIGYKY